MKRKIAWHDQARRMLASGAYPSKAAIARELNKSDGRVYEVLSPDAGTGIAQRRLDRQRAQYRSDPMYRAEKIAKARAYVEANPSACRTGSGKYPLQIRCDAAFLGMLDAWIARQPTPLTRSEAVRSIVRSAIGSDPSPTTGAPDA